MNRDWAFCSSSFSKLSMTNGLRSSQRMGNRSDNSAKRSVRGSTPASTSRLIVWVEFIQPNAIQSQWYWIRSVFSMCVLAADWKQKLLYSSTDRMVVRYNVSYNCGVCSLPCSRDCSHEIDSFLTFLCQIYNVLPEGAFRVEPDPEVFRRHTMSDCLTHQIFVQLLGSILFWYPFSSHFLNGSEFRNCLKKIISSRDYLW